MEDAHAIHRALVEWAADTAPDGWERVEIDMEVLADETAASNSWIMRWFSAQGRLDFTPSGARKLKMRDLFLRLNDLSAKDGARWTVCHFTAFSDGRFTLRHSYDPPPRLSGR